ncbi:MAG: hypothetical protein JKY88_13030 [Pseudomonadales bacterium]|nr:hypothetical protein [Pseudomonadales bacterium]
MPKVLADTPFEKIFTEKNQRYQLDKLRLQSEGNQENPDSKEDQISVEKNQVKQLSKTHKVRFGGYITHQNGSEVYWVDGETELGESARDVRVERDEANKKFIFHTSDSQTSLKPGQVWLVDKEQIVERYQLDQDKIEALVDVLKGTPADAALDNDPAKK